MVGEEPGSAIDPEEKRISFTHKSLLKKSIIVAAGPLFNFLLAIFIFYTLYQFSGLYLAKPVVGKVVENTPASTAGIKAGDVIREINKNEIHSFEDITRIIGKSSPGGYRPPVLLGPK